MNPIKLWTPELFRGESALAGIQFTQGRLALATRGEGVFEDHASFGEEENQSRPALLFPRKKILQKYEKRIYIG